MNLAVDTPRGEEWLREQQEAVDIVFGKSPYRFVRTKTKKAPLDGVIYEGDVLDGVAEVKCRDMVDSQLFGEFKGEWLISANKISFMKSACICLECFGYGILYLRPSKKVLVIKICDPSGAIIPPIRFDRCETQATCNGGTAWRVNAFVQMRGSTEYRA